MHPSRRLCPQTTSASTAARAPAAAIVSSASYLSTWLTILSFVNEPRSVFFLFFFSFLFTRIERWNISGREGMRGDLADWKKIIVEYFQEDFNFLSFESIFEYSCRSTRCTLFFGGKSSNG